MRVLWTVAFVALAALPLASAAPSGILVTGNVSGGAKGGFSVQSDGGVVKGEFQFRAPDGRVVHAKDFSLLIASGDCTFALFVGVDTQGNPFNAFVLDHGPGSADQVFVVSGGAFVLSGNVHVRCR